MTGPSRVAFSEHAVDQLARRGISERRVAETVLVEHPLRRRNSGSAGWLISSRGIEIVYNWPDRDGLHRVCLAAVAYDGLVKPESYYSPEGDLAYLLVRPSDRVRTEKREWGLCDYDLVTGELAGLEIWEASQVLPRELVEALPSVGRSDVVMTREDLAKSKPL